MRLNNLIFNLLRLKTSFLLFIRGNVQKLNIIYFISGGFHILILALSFTAFGDKNLSDETLINSRGEYILLDMSYNKKINVNSTDSSHKTHGNTSATWVKSELEFENRSQCNINRLYMEHPETKYSSPREIDDLDSAEIPRKCILFSMKYFAEKITGATDSLSPSFAKCSSSMGFPDHGQLAPCMTEEYVNGVYNSFIDVMDCFEVPQKLVTPLIFFESGFHTNSFVPFQEINNKGVFSDLIRYPSRKYAPNGETNLIGGRAGVGLLDQWSLSEVKNHIEFWRAKMTVSTRKSCQRLRKSKEEFPRSSRIHLSNEMRCALINPSTNPLESMIYLGVLFKSRMTQISDSWNQLHIDHLLEKLAPDLLKSKGKMELAQQNLFILSQYLGPRKTVLLFKNWLKSRAKLISKHPITEQDFQFSQLSPLSQVHQAPTVMPARQQKIEFADAAESSPSEEELKSMETIRFQDYLINHYSPWLGNLLNSFFMSNDTLNQNLGEGVCTSASYHSS